METVPRRASHTASLGTIWSVVNEPSHCPICGGSAEILREITILGEYAAFLRRCAGCEFCFLADPEWLESSFAAHLHQMDVGSVDRSGLMAQFLLGFLGASRRRRSWRVLDIGGGDGLLVRLLRDRGIAAQFSDPHTTPTYDVGPAVADSDRFEVAVMSEVALHLTDPVGTFRGILERCDRLLFTAVVPPDPMPFDWWYLMPSTGQHVAFYPVPAIESIAGELGCHWCSDGKFFHLISTSPIPRTLRFLVRRREATLLIAWVRQLLDLIGRARGRQRSFTASDQARVEAALNTGEET